MRQTKQQTVYEYIKNKINSNEYPPGTPLTEESICSELNVSRTPVRDAIRRLTSEELLILTPGVGLSVSSIGLEDLIEIFDIREGLEGLAVRLFIDRAPDATISQLRSCYEKCEDAIRHNDFRQFMDHDMRFHRIIDATVRNKRLSSMLDSIYDQINRLACINREDPEVCRLALSGHGRILQAIESHDRQAAVDAMETHLREVKRYYLSKYFNL